MSKRQLVFIGLVLFLLLAGGYLAYERHSKAPNISQIPETAINPASTTSPQTDTSTWKTYRNEQYGFEVKYPASFNENNTEVSSSVRIANFDWKPGYYNWPSNAALIFVFTDPENASQKYQDYKTAEKNFSLGGEKARKIVSEFSIGDGGSKIIVKTIKNSVFYYIEITPLNQRNEELFNKILSTFRFIK